MQPNLPNIERYSRYPHGTAAFLVKNKDMSLKEFEELEEARFSQALTMIEADIHLLLPDVGEYSVWKTDAIQHLHHHVKTTSAKGVVLARWRFLPGLMGHHIEVVNDIIKDVCNGFLTTEELATSKSRLEYKREYSDSILDYNVYKPYARKKSIAQYGEVHET